MPIDKAIRIKTTSFVPVKPFFPISPSGVRIWSALECPFEDFVEIVGLK
jgi:hypothetical protein